MIDKHANLHLPKRTAYRKPVHERFAKKQIQLRKVEKKQKNSEHSEELHGPKTTPFYQPYKFNQKITLDHPLDIVSLDIQMYCD